MPYGKTYSVKESAAYLRMSTKTVRRYLKKGALKYKTIRGQFGDEIRIYKNSLDSMIGQKKPLSKVQDDLSELCRLYRRANPEVREVVLKILRSTFDGEGKEERNGLISSLFRKMGGNNR